MSDEDRELMVKLHQLRVKQFVINWFSVSRKSLSTLMIDQLTRTEIEESILEALLEHGQFPIDAAMSEGPPILYFGEQIRALNDGAYLVANCEFYAFSSKEGSSYREFANARDAVKYFVLSEVRNHLGGVPVV